MTLAIGGCTIGELQARMGHTEFMDWCAFYAIEPFGARRADLQTALLASLIANANRDTKKRKDPFMPSDFMFDYWPAAAVQTEEALELAHAQMLLAKFMALTSNIEQAGDVPGGLTPAKRNDGPL